MAPMLGAASRQKHTKAASTLEMLGAKSPTEPGRRNGRTAEEVQRRRWQSSLTIFGSALGFAVILGMAGILLRPMATAANSDSLSATGSREEAALRLLAIGPPTAEASTPSKGSRHLRFPVADLLPWQEAIAKATQVLTDMTVHQKHTLLAGIEGPGFPVTSPGYFVGNTEPIHELGVPGLKMQDAGQGFRPTNPHEEGTTTQWPSILALAASWDEHLVHWVAAAMGREFRGKGANVMLGPGVNVHRTPVGGRNFEYLSGEDPYLGSRLTKQYVRGIQDQGVMAVVKHFAFNEQETNRMSVNSQVDERTAWELYYPPFEAAIEAGASAFMCAYNRVNGIYSCENEALLNQDLRGKMGFRGLVMSDWDATHSTDSVSRGLDIELPRRKWFTDSKLKDPWVIEHTSALCEDSKLFDNCCATGPFDHESKCAAKCEATPGCNFYAYGYNPDGYYRCATYAVCNQPVPYHGGDVNVYKRVQVDPFAGAVDQAVIHILASIYHMRLDQRPHCEIPCTSERDSNQRTEDHQKLAAHAATKSVVLLQNKGVLPLDLSKVRTIAVIGSAAVAADNKDMWQGSPYTGGGSGHVYAPEVVTPLAVITERAQQAGIKVLNYTGPSTTEAEQVVRQADVAVVIASVTSGEGTDRKNLGMGMGTDALIVAVAGVRPTIALLQTPGAVLTPWRSVTSAIATLFYGGEQTGKAWAAILFGDRAPTGRLPVAFPDDDQSWPHPSTGKNAPYREGLLTSYRALTGPAPAFPFGHGLAYTTFEYEAVTSTTSDDSGGFCSEVGSGWSLAEARACVRLKVRNTGRRAGVEVVQAYLRFTGEPDQPRFVLRGFARTKQLEPGEIQDVALAFSARDLSVYFPEGGWRVAKGPVEVHVGASSGDIRRVVTLRL